MERRLVSVVKVISYPEKVTAYTVQRFMDIHHAHASITSIRPQDPRDEATGRRKVTEFDRDLK